MLKEQQRGRCGWSRAGWEMKYEESAGEKSFRVCRPQETLDLTFYFIFYFCPCHAACGILIPCRGIEPMPLALEAILHWKQ